MKTKSWMAVGAAVLSLMLAGCAATTRPPSTARVIPARARITVLYDAFGKASNMKKDWGYAALIEVNGKRILFDTGDNPDIFAQNVRAKGVDLTRLDFVVMSHRHGDHMGGLTYLLTVNPNVKIYAPNENFGVYGFSLPSSFYRKADGLPSEQRYYDGAPPAVMKFGSAWPTAHFELVDTTTVVTPGIHLIALVSDNPPTLELKELSLAIDTPDGVVLVVGCAHPGIERIVEAARAINPHIHLVTGGLHMVVAQEDEIQRVTTALHDTYRVDYVAPGHCTGEPTFAALKQAFGDRYVYMGLGTTLGLGKEVRPIAVGDYRSGVQAIDEADSRTHRGLLAGSADYGGASR